jgi:hypothetical protein
MIIHANSIEEKAVLASYIASRIGTTPQSLVGHMPFTAGSVLRNGKPIGAVLYTNFREHSVEFAAAGEPGWMTRPTVEQMFEFPFQQLNVWTLLALIARANSNAREISKRLGFSELCVIGAGETKVDDMILYGMTRNKCRWLKGKPAMNGAAYNKTQNGVAAHG